MNATRELACTHPVVVRQVSALLAGVKLSGFLGHGFHTAGFRIDDPHVVPVVGKLLAATQADKVGAGDRRDLGTRLAFTTGNQWSAFLMAAAKDPGPGQRKQFNDHKHLSDGESRRDTTGRTESSLAVIICPIS